MEIAVKYSAVAIVAILCGSMLKDIKSPFSTYVVLVAGIGIIIACLNVLPAVMGFADRISSDLPELSQGIEVVFKVCGITFVTRICAQTCRDCGEGGLGMKLELLGNLLAVVLSLPLIETVFLLITGLLKT
ncbi:MAG: hypothetical protein IKM04_06855 [Clostridia bacterium]|nr:hypothetical protein [Clostridia bacterium]